MADQYSELVDPPFTTFNFLVEITVDGVSEKVCSAAFSECEGLEISMQPKTIREGGNNGRPIHLSGPAAYGQLTLKRGMSTNFDLWDWFEKVLTPGNHGLRATADVIIQSAAQKPVAKFSLTGCMPVKLKAPALNAKEGQVAIEEMQLVYETLTLKRSGGTGGENRG